MNSGAYGGVFSSNYYSPQTPKPIPQKAQNPRKSIIRFFLENLKTPSTFIDIENNLCPGIPNKELREIFWELRDEGILKEVEEGKLLIFLFI